MDPFQALTIGTKFSKEKDGKHQQLFQNGKFSSHAVFDSMNSGQRDAANEGQGIAVMAPAPASTLSIQPLSSHHRSDGEREGDGPSDATQQDKPLKKMSMKKVRNIWRKHDVKVTGTELPDPIEHFSDLVRPPLCAPHHIVDNLFRREHKQPTAIQSQAIPTLIHRRDLLACAPTGSGKTIAFLVPMFTLLRAPDRSAGLRGLVVTPTMELAMQIEREAFFLMRGKRWRFVQHGQTTKDKDFFVSTPGRVVSMLEQKLVDLSHVEYVVFDEGDRLWDAKSDFFAATDTILTACSRRDKVVSLFSATLSEHVEAAARSVMQNPVRLIVKGRKAANSNVHQRILFCGSELGKIVAMRNLIREGLTAPVLVFVQSIERSKDLYDEIHTAGLHMRVMHAKMTTEEREDVVLQFRLGKIWVLVTTELLARGMDFKNVNTVINFDFPPSAESYIHRIGRSGRAGKTGEAITFLTIEDKERLPPIAKIMKESGSPVEDWMLAIKVDRSTRRRLANTTPKRMVVSTRKRVMIAEKRYDQQMKRLKRDGEMQDDADGDDAAAGEEPNEDDWDNRLKHSTNVHLPMTSNRRCLHTDIESLSFHQSFSCRSPTGMVEDVIETVQLLALAVDGEDTFWFCERRQKIPLQPDWKRTEVYWLYPVEAEDLPPALRSCPGFDPTDGVYELPEGSAHSKVIRLATLRFDVPAKKVTVEGRTFFLVPAVDVHNVSALYKEFLIREEQAAAAKAELRKTAVKEEEVLGNQLDDDEEDGAHPPASKTSKLRDTSTVRRWGRYYIVSRGGVPALCPEASGNTYGFRLQRVIDNDFAVFVLFHQKRAPCLELSPHDTGTPVLEYTTMSGEETKSARQRSAMIFTRSTWTRMPSTPEGKEKCMTPAKCIPPQPVLPLDEPMIVPDTSSGDPDTDSDDEDRRRKRRRAERGRRQVSHRPPAPAPSSAPVVSPGPAGPKASTHPRPRATGGFNKGKAEDRPPLRIAGVHLYTDVSGPPPPAEQMAATFPLSLQAPTTGLTTAVLPSGVCVTYSPATAVALSPSNRTAESGFSADLDMRGLLENIRLAKEQAKASASDVRLLHAYTNNNKTILVFHFALRVGRAFRPVHCATSPGEWGGWGGWGVTGEAPMLRLVAFFNPLHYLILTLSFFSFFCFACCRKPKALTRRMKATMWALRTARLGSSFHALSLQVRLVSQGRHFAAACEGLPMTPSGRNPYDVLELTLQPSLPLTDIAKQYRQLVVRYHPDKPEGSTEKMTEVNLAYKILKEHHESVLARWTRAESVAQTHRSGAAGGYQDNRSRDEFVSRARRQRPAQQAERQRPRRQFHEIAAQWKTLTSETDTAATVMCRRYELAAQQAIFLRAANAMNEITAKERWLRKTFIKSLWENVHELRGELLQRGTRSAQQSELAESMVVYASQIQRKLNDDFQQRTQQVVLRQARLLAERGLAAITVFVMLVKFWLWRHPPASTCDDYPANPAEWVKSMRKRLTGSTAQHWLAVIHYLPRRSYRLTRQRSGRRGGSGNVSIVRVTHSSGSVGFTFRFVYSVGTELHRNSASIDPYALAEVDQAEDVKVSQWVEHVEKELTDHKSPFVAADVIMKQMQERAISMRHPDKLYLETALKVLEHCAAHIASPFRELFLSALHELIPALVFTRVTYTPSTGAETFAKHSYAECFLQVYKVFLAHRRTIEVHERRVEVERTVMDRVVSKLDGLWIKFCFSAWRIYCKKIRDKKIMFAKIAQYSIAHQVAPMMIRRWRQHAHTVILRAKHQRSDQLTNELNALHRTVESMLAESDKLRGEVTQKVKYLGHLKSEYDNTAAKLEDLKQLLEATQKSVMEHWHEWQRCKRLLFEDAHPFPASLRLGIDNRSGKVTFVSNITDSSSLYYNRARALAKKIDIEHIHRIMRVYGLYTPTDIMLPAAAHLRFPESTPSIESVSAILRSACAPALSPFAVRDVTHYHRDKFNFVVSFIHTMYGGGHCSLFPAPKIPSAEDCMPDPYSPAGSKGRSVSGISMATFTAEPGVEEDDAVVGVSQAALSGEEDSQNPMSMGIEDLSARMMQDVSDGLESLNEACDLNDDLAASIRRCITNTEVDEVRNYLEGLFEKLSTVGKPLNRSKIEAVTFTMVDKNDYRVMETLYPPSGIDSFTSLVNYITGVAEFTSWPILTVAEMLESHYDFDWRDDMLLTLASADMAHFFYLNTKIVAALQGALSDKEADKEHLCFENVRKLFMSRLQLSTSEIEHIWENAGAEPDKVRTTEIDQLLYIAAAWVDPSPFTPPLHKVAAVIDRFVPYLRDLRKKHRKNHPYPITSQRKSSLQLLRSDRDPRQDVLKACLLSLPSFHGMLPTPDPVARTQHRTFASFFALHPSGSLLATCCSDGAVEVYYPSDKAWVHGCTLRDHAGPILRCSWCPSRSVPTLATVGADRRFRLYDFDLGGAGGGCTPTRWPPTWQEKDVATDVAFVPPGQVTLLSTATLDGQVRVYEVKPNNQPELVAPWCPEAAAVSGVSALSWFPGRDERWMTVAAGCVSGHCVVARFAREKGFEEVPLRSGSTPMRCSDAVLAVAWAPAVGRRFSLLAFSSRREVVVLRFNVISPSCLDTSEPVDVEVFRTNFGACSLSWSQSATSLLLGSDAAGDGVRCLAMSDPAKHSGWEVVEEHTFELTGIPRRFTR
eukprot:gene13350-9182_t